jgi:hypothetical protein
MLINITVTYVRQKTPPCKDKQNCGAKKEIERERISTNWLPQCNKLS